MPPVRTGLIDIDAAAVRLLVADLDGGSLIPVLERRHDVRPRRGTEPALAALARAEAVRARAAGAEGIEVAAASSLRRYSELRRLDRACRNAGAGPLRVLTPGEEARLAFRGATATQAGPYRRAVVAVGGGSASVAIGEPGASPDWWAARPLGSRLLTESVGLDDPPSPDQLAALRASVSRRLASLEPPPSAGSLVAGDDVTALELLCGPALDADGLARALAGITSSPSDRVGGRLGVAPERASRLPATLIVLAELCALLPLPLEIASGGLPEGLALRLAGEPTMTGSGG